MTYSVSWTNPTHWPQHVHRNFILDTSLLGENKECVISKWINSVFVSDKMSVVDMNVVYIAYWCDPRCCSSNISPLRSLNSCWSASLISLVVLPVKEHRSWLWSPASLIALDGRNRISSGKWNTLVEAHQGLFPVTQRRLLARHETHNSCMGLDLSFTAWAPYPIRLDHGGKAK